MFVTREVIFKDFISVGVDPDVLPSLDILSCSPGRHDNAISTTGHKEGTSAQLGFSMRVLSDANCVLVCFNYRIHPCVGRTQV